MWRFIVPVVFLLVQDESLQPDDPLPSVDEITYFVGSIVGVGELAPQSCIMAIAYLSRIRPKLHIHLLNWRRVTLSSLILGCKVWEEHPVFNTDFNELFPEMSGKLLGQLEKTLLNLLRFNVGLTGSEYAKYYFELRDMSPAAFAAHDNPLTDDEIQRLEERSSDAAVRNQMIVISSVIDVFPFSLFISAMATCSSCTCCIAIGQLWSAPEEAWRTGCRRDSKRSEFIGESGVVEIGPMEQRAGLVGGGRLVGAERRQSRRERRR
jgi:hypothetical protein